MSVEEIKNILPKFTIMKVLQMPCHYNIYYYVRNSVVTFGTRIQLINDKIKCTPF